MKHGLVVGIAFASLTVGSAMAADLGLPAKGPFVEPLYSWTGCYAGPRRGRLAYLEFC